MLVFDKMPKSTSYTAEVAQMVKLGGDNVPYRIQLIVSLLYVCCKLIFNFFTVEKEDYKYKCDSSEK